MVLSRLPYICQNSMVEANRSLLSKSPVRLLSESSWSLVVSQTPVRILVVLSGQSDSYQNPRGPYWSVRFVSESLCFILVSQTPVRILVVLSGQSDSCQNPRGSYWSVRLLSESSWPILVL